MNNGLKLVKENQFYIDMLVSKKLRMGETKKIIAVLESMYNADDLKNIKNKFKNNKWRVESSY
jgi:hypothetical protein|tara:strand:+ start:157 stop:345 length:189 start_codon:yes stop_codon:yes gene_type:complete